MIEINTFYLQGNKFFYDNEYLLLIGEINVE